VLAQRAQHEALGHAAVQPEPELILRCRAQFEQKMIGAAVDSDVGPHGAARREHALLTGLDRPVSRDDAAPKCTVEERPHLFSIPRIEHVLDRAAERQLPVEREQLSKRGIRVDQ